MPDDDSSSRYGITHKPVLLRSLLCERQVVHAKRSEARLSAAASGAALAAACTAVWLSHVAREDGETTLRRCGDGVLGAVGNTPLVRIASLSDATGCEIYGKAELTNPGGSVKDRVAVRILQEALASGALRPGGLVTEGTAGSTGISLAMMAPAFGCKCHVVMPDDAAEEKAVTIAALGASVQRVRPVSITHPDHFVNVARRAAASAVASGGPGAAFFADQFENEANFRAHFDGTGAEVWAQTRGTLHAFVAAAGTGGTLAGVGAALRARDPGVRLYLVDPPGSSLYNRVTRGVMYAATEAEGKRTRHQVDTVTEGIGINRLTANFLRAPRLDGAFRGSDQEAIAMARHLRAADGLFVGSSAAMNAVGALRVAQELGPGHTVVTLLCDGGARHLSKFWSDDYLAAAGLLPPPEQAGRELQLLLSGALRPTEA